MAFIQNLRSLSHCFETSLRFFSLDVDRCIWPIDTFGIVDTVAAAFNAIDAGNTGLHGECELSDELDDCSGIPGAEYKSCFNL